MNYEPNTTHWNCGDIVIHDADAKEPKMLMKIVGFTREGLAKCRYIDKYRKQTVYPNPIAPLHDPSRFGINPKWGEHGHNALSKYQGEWERVRFWNAHYTPGQRVRTTSEDGGFETVTTGAAYQTADGYAFVRLQRGGAWLLSFVEAVRS